MVRTKCLLSLATALILTTSLAFAQDPVTGRPGKTAPDSKPTPVQTPPVDKAQATTAPVITSLVLSGSEDLAGYGKLTFTARDGGIVNMVDANNTPVEGKYRVEGQRVTFTFKDCIYQGTFQNNGILVGRAWFTSGAREGETWNFRVQIRK